MEPTDFKNIKQPQFYPSLEGLRGVAILSVLVSHLLILSNSKYSIFLPLDFGGWGVNLFFVLSGFLITGILLRDIHSHKPAVNVYKNFFMRRVLRIFPIYYLSIILLAIFNVENSTAILPYTLSYTYNIYEAFLGSFSAFANSVPNIFMHI